MRAVFVHDLDLLRLVFMVKHGYASSYEGDRCLIEFSVKGESPVFGHAASGLNAEMIFEVLRG